MSEYEDLRTLKQKWLKENSSYAMTLCLAVLAIGKADDLGNPDSVRRHRMNVRSVRCDDIKITASEASGNYLTELSDYSTTRKLMVLVGTRKAVYMTFTNDPMNNDLVYNFIVPGVWMDFADQTIKDARILKEQLRQKQEDLDTAKLKEQLLVGVLGFGENYGSQLKEVK